MGRPPKLSDRQKAEIGRRLAQGEKPSALAKEFKVGLTTIKDNFSGKVSVIKETAKALAAVELEVASLPISDQVSVRTLADQLKGLSESAAQAGATGMKTASLLHKKALKKVQELDEDATVEDLRLSDAMLTVAGKASALGLGLMNTNRGKAPEPPADDLSSLPTEELLARVEALKGRL